MKLVSCMWQGSNIRYTFIQPFQVNVLTRFQSDSKQNVRFFTYKVGRLQQKQAIAGEFPKF